MYSFRVVATDGGGRRAYADVNVTILDKNDNDPVFQPDRYQKEVKEDVIVTTEIVTVTAKDKDSGVHSKLTYSIINASDKDKGSNAKVTYSFESSINKFVINKDTGEIKTNGLLDREKKSSYTAIVVATDGGISSRLDKTQVTIVIRDVNDNSPVFNPSQYNEKVYEDVAVGSTLVRVRATDADEAASPNSDVILLIASLDREKKERYILHFLNMTDFVNVPEKLPVGSNVTRVKAVDNDDGDNGRIEYEIVHDANDNRPTFERNPIIASVYEGVSINHTVKTVQARDDDSGSNSWIMYSIDSQNPEAHFKINPMTGTVQTISKIDREAISENITYVMEDEPFNFEVMTITAIDQDTDSSGKVEYRTVGGDSGKFTLDPRTDEGKPALSSFQLLTIKIVDVNDNPPEFTKKLFDGSVSEGEPVGWVTTNATLDREEQSTYLFVVYATGTKDLDDGLNAKMKYRIISGNNDGAFHISADTGELSNVIKLDRESIDKYILTLEAKDVAKPFYATTCKVIVIVQDSNDNRPHFLKSKYSRVISEKTPVGKVDAQTGVITTESRFDTNVMSEFKFHCFAHDQSSDPKMDFALITVTIKDMNTHYPVFSKTPYQTSVFQNASSGMTVVTVSAIDADTNKTTNGKVSFRMKDDSSSSKLFVLESNTGILKTSPTFRNPPSGRHIFYIIAQDHGQPPKASDGIIDVLIGTVKDDPPVFINQSKSTVGIPENTPTNGYVTKLIARNKNNNPITYNIISDVNDNDPVFHPSNIVIQLPEDDGSFVPRTVVMEIRVREDTRPGSVITIATATDADQDNQLTYTLKSESVAQTFAVSRFSGSVTLLKSLDFESIKKYSVVIRVSDGKHHDDVTINIHVTDVNDNPPAFLNSSYQLKLTQTVRAGVPLLRVSATDKDSGVNGKVRYSFLQPIPEFQINVTSGVISTQKRIEVGIRDALNQILVVATDQGSPAQRAFVYVRILITGEPQFDRAQYTASVPEYVTVDTSVLTVKTTGNPPSTPSARISFVIESGDIRNQFRIGQRSGIIRINSALDYETNQRYQLVIRAFDDIAPSNLVRVTVLINVTDANDMKPVFRKPRYISQWEENVAIGTIVMNVSASDGDSGSNSKVWYSIQSGDDERSFAIDRYTGVIRTVKELDHDSIKNHHLSVRATDQGTPPLHSEVSVTIQVLDLNDNAPVFHIPNPGQIRVPENSPESTVFYNLTATDKDSDANGRLTYSIIGGEGDGLFVIDPLTGLLRTNAKFDYEIKSTYSLDVKVIDSGSPPLQSNISIIINIASVDEYLPVFQSKGYGFKVPGNAEVGDFVGQVSATDRDGGEDGEVFYSFVNPTSDALTMNKTSGVVTVNRTLNDGSKLQQQRERRSIDYPESSSIGIAARARTRREAEENQIHMTVQADSGKPHSKWATSFVYVTVDFACPGCGIVTKGRQTGGGIS
ncbi:hypothetical protein QZH41_016609, partial [Actinostola sp. cb2023]